MRLLKTQTITVYRKGTEGYINADGDWVPGTDADPFDIEGNLQPYKRGKTRIEPPEGVRTQDMRVLYTSRNYGLYTSDEDSNQEPDEIELDGVRYMCFHVEDWGTYGIIPDNWQHFFVRTDKVSR